MTSWSLISWGTKNHGGDLAGGHQLPAKPLHILAVTFRLSTASGLAVWGVINLLEGYGSDNPAAKSQGIKQLMAGGGVVLIGLQLISAALRVIMARSYTNSSLSRSSKFNRSASSSVSEPSTSYTVYSSSGFRTVSYSSEAGRLPP